MSVRNSAELRAHACVVRHLSAVSVCVCARVCAHTHTGEYRLGAAPFSVSKCTERTASFFSFASLADNFAPTHVSEPEAVYRQRCRRPPSPVQPSSPAAPRAAAQHAGGSGRAPAQPPRTGATRGTTLQLTRHACDSRLSSAPLLGRWRLARTSVCPRARRERERKCTRLRPAARGEAAPAAARTPPPPRGPRSPRWVALSLFLLRSDPQGGPLHQEGVV